FADVVSIYNADKRCALDAIRHARHQHKRTRQLWDMKGEDVPVYGTIAIQFNDPGTNSLYKAIMDEVVKKTGADLNSTFEITDEMSEKVFVIPPNRTRYLSEIAENNRAYDKWAKEQAETADKLYSINRTIETISDEEIKKVLE